MMAKGALSGKVSPVVWEVSAPALRASGCGSQNFRYNVWTWERKRRQLRFAGNLRSLLVLLGVVFVLGDLMHIRCPFVSSGHLASTFACLFARALPSLAADDSAAPSPDRDVDGTSFPADKTRKVVAVLHAAETEPTLISSTGAKNNSAHRTSDMGKRSRLRKLKQILPQILEVSGIWGRPPVRDPLSYFERKLPKASGNPDESLPRRPGSGQSDIKESKSIPFYSPTWWELFSYYRTLPTVRREDMREIENLQEFEEDRAWYDRSMVVVLSSFNEKVLEQLGIQKEAAEYGLVLKVWIPRRFGKAHFTREAFIHQFLWHHRDKFSFLLPFLGALRLAEGSPSVYMILPKGRGLLSMLRTQPICNFRLACAELVCALKDLNDHGFVHRDVTASNVLIMPDGHLALSDFETVRREGVLAYCVGTIGSMAPEIEKCSGRLLPILKTHKLHDVYNLGKTFEKMRKTRIKAGMKVVSENLFKRMIKKMTDQDITKRLPLDKVLQHPYFREIDFPSVRRKAYGAPFLPLKEFSNQKQFGLLDTDKRFPRVEMIRYDKHTVSWRLDKHGMIEL